MRVTIITSWATDIIGGSGTAVFFNTFHEGLRAQGYEVDLITPNFDTTDYVDATLRRFLFNADLHHDPRIQKADVLIGFDYDGYGLDPAARPPFIASAHAIFGDVYRWEHEPFKTMVRAQSFFDQINMERADMVTAGSHYAQSRISALYGIAADKIRVIPHGMARPSWMDEAALPPAPKDHPVILAVGKMYPRKRLDVLLRAVPFLRETFPNIEVRIVGMGLEWDNLHQLTDELAINASITWLAHLEDPQDFAREWRQADIFCHPSSQESFGFVYLEAMMLGKAIVAVQSGAAPEVLADAGLLVEPENPQALAEAITRFLEDSSLRQRYGERGKLRAPRFTVESMIKGYAEVIDQVCGSRRG